MMVGAAFFFSLMSAFVKSLGGTLPSQEIVLVRSAVTLGYSYALVRWAGKALWGNNRTLLVLRGLFGLGGMSCFFWALTALPLADATVLHYTNPIITVLLAALVLDETLGRAEIGGALLSLAGVALIAQPSFLFDGASGLNPAYVGVALGGAFFSSCAYVTVRKLRATEDPLVIVLYFPLVATLGSIPLTAAAQPAWPTLWEWAVLVAGRSRHRTNRADLAHQRPACRTRRARHVDDVSPDRLRSRLGRSFLRRDARPMERGRGRAGRRRNAAGGTREVIPTRCSR